MTHAKGNKDHNSSDENNSNNGIDYRIMMIE